MAAEAGQSLAPLLQGAFIALCLVLVVLVHAIPRFDLRSLLPGGRRDPGASATPEGTGAARGAGPLERPDLGAIVNLLVLACTGFAVLVGWRVPAEIERLYGTGAGFGLIFPSVEMTTLGRAAQVVGAVALGLTALRLLRLLVPLAGVVLAILLGVWAAGYILGADLLPPPF